MHVTNMQIDLTFPCLYVWLNACQPFTIYINVIGTLKQYNQRYIGLIKNSAHTVHQLYESWIYYWMLHKNDNTE